LLRLRPAPRPALVPYTTLFRSGDYSWRIILVIGHVLGFVVSRGNQTQHTSGANWDWCEYELLDSLLDSSRSPPAGCEWVFLLQRSEEHTSELQSRANLVCCLLL